MKNKLIPDHALALSQILSDEILSVELTYEEAIRYLQRQDLSIKPDSLGWQTVRFKGHNLGWINVLSNRINNYYPKELRILKQSI
jgi:NOL1/NOP2/fmu family ribosome biogenesis protein